MTWIVKRTNTF